MGGFAINGRQAWALFLGRDLTGVARDRKLWGLDYSPGEMNIHYIEPIPRFVASWSRPARCATTWPRRREI
jgi:hypothetical protein